MRVYPRKSAILRHLALISAVGLAATASRAEAQTTLVYSATVTYGTQKLPGIVCITIEPINPADTTNQPHNCDFYIGVGTPGSVTPGTLVYATNQRYLDGLASDLNLETALGAVNLLSSTLTFTSQASSKSIGAVNANYFMITPPKGTFGMGGTMQVVSGTVNLSLSKDGKTITGNISLGGSNNALLYPTPSYTYTASITGSIETVLDDVPVE